MHIRVREVEKGRMLRPRERVTGSLDEILSGILRPALEPGHPSYRELDGAVGQFTGVGFVEYVTRRWGHLFGVPPHAQQVLPALLDMRFGPLTSGGAMDSELMHSQEWVDGRWIHALKVFAETVPVWAESFRDISAITDHFLQALDPMPWSDVAVRFFKLFVIMYVASIMRNHSVLAWPIAKGRKSQELMALVSRLHAFARARANLLMDGLTTTRGGADLDIDQALEIERESIHRSWRSFTASMSRTPKAPFLQKLMAYVEMLYGTIIGPFITLSPSADPPVTPVDAQRRHDWVVSLSQLRIDTGPSGV